MNWTRVEREWAIRICFGNGLEQKTEGAATAHAERKEMGANASHANHKRTELDVPMCN